MSFPKTILMIEDDAPTREVVRMACVGQNLTLLEADTGEKGMEMIEKSEPDLVILDLNLPGVSGMDVCRQLRADGTQVPVIMLTAKNDTIDVVVGLEVGADDYLTKPFEVRELLARVGAHLRRSEQAVAQALPKTRFEFPGLIIDMNSRQVWREGKEVALTLTERDRPELDGLIRLHDVDEGPLRAALDRRCWDHDIVLSHFQQQMDILYNLRHHPTG